MNSKAILSFVVMLLICVSSSFTVAWGQQGVITLDAVDTISTGIVDTGASITFSIRWNNNSGSAIVGFTNGYRIYSPDGATWFATDTGAYTGAITPGMTGNQFINYNSVDGSGADTIGFGGFTIFGTGVPDGFDAVVYTMTIDSIPASSIGKQICIDSSFYPSSGIWKWSTSAGNAFPTWDGPHCFDIVTGGGATGGSFSLDHVDGLAGQDTLATGVPITFHIRLTNQTGNSVTGLTNGFQVYSPTGSQWNSTTADTTGAITGAMIENFFINGFSLDGMGVDTVGFGGFRLFGTGIPDGFDAVAYQVQIGPIDPAFGGGQICLDSSYYPPAGIWKWSTTGGDHFPSWDGPHCFDIAGTPAQQRIVSVNPDNANQGESLFVTITGENTKFGMGGTTVRLIDQFGLLEMWSTGVNVFNNTFMQAFFDIDDTATIGPYSLTVFVDGQDSVALSPAFWVNPPAHLVSIDPDTAQQGDALSVTIVGQNTRFHQASWTALSRSFERIWPSSFTAINDTIMTAFYNIPPFATLGQWDVEVSQGGILSLPGAFTILAAGQPQIVAVDPDTAYQGQSLEVFITGQNTRFLQASMVSVRLSDSMYSSIIATSVTVLHDEMLRAHFNIPNSAPPGYRDVTVTQGVYGAVTAYGAFRILPTSMEADILLDHVDGLVGPGILGVNRPIRLHLRLRNNTGESIVGLTNGFRLYSQTGAQWGSTSGQWTSAVTDSMYEQRFVNLFSQDGMNADTIGFGGFRFLTPGIPPGFDDTTWTIDIGPIPASESGKQICIDSAFYPPAGLWLWSLGAAKIGYIPSWDGPHCFVIDSLPGGAPQIVVQPDSFFVSQAPNDSTVRTLTIGNGGGVPLNYQLDIVFAESLSTSGNTEIEVDPEVVAAQEDAQASIDINSHLTVREANGVDKAVYQELLNKASTSDEVTDLTSGVSAVDPANKTDVMIEDFEGNMIWPWAPWITVGSPSGQATAGCAHDGLRGVGDSGFLEWNYRTDVTVGMPGCRLSLWVMPAPGTGRAYMGFGATATGAWSLVAAPNTNTLIIQQNNLYDFLDLAAVSQAYVPDSWYKLEVVFGDSGFVTGNLYAADGTTLLNSVSTIIPNLPQAGVALRCFENFCMDSFESVNDMSSGWLRADHHSGSVPGGGADDVMLTFDASNLNPGQYYAAIIINSNDPVNQSLMVSARMLVTGVGMTDLSLLNVDGLTMAGKLPIGQPVSFHIGLHNTTAMNTVGSTNGFRIYSPTGARWTTTTGSPTGAIDSTMYDQGLFVSPFSIDGMGADTIGFGGFRMFGSGIPVGFNEDVWTIDIGPIPQSYAGGTICLDSAFYRPAGIWKWSLGPAKIDYTPTWDGPHCFQIDDLFQPCSLSVTPTLLSYTAVAGGPNPPCQNMFPITNCTYAMEFDTSWISVVPGEIGEFVCVDVGGLLPGHYHDTVHIWLVEDTMMRAAVAVDLMVLSDSSCGLQYFTDFVETGLLYPYVIASPPACDLAAGDEIGLFDAEQGLLVGALPYCGEPFPLSINAWQGDSLHGLPGYIPGHTLEVQVYKMGTNEVLCAGISGSCLSFNECSFGIIDSMSCRGCFMDFCTPFPIEADKWQTISFPLSPIVSPSLNNITCDIAQILAPLHQIDIVKDDHGGVYIPSFGVNTIGCTDPGEGYDLFKFGMDQQLCIIGSEVPPFAAMIKANRWNILGYPLVCPVPIDVVMQWIADSLDIVKDDNGGVFIPIFGINTIGDMIPGKGYKAFLSTRFDLMLSYPTCFEPFTTPSNGGVPFSKPADDRVRHFEFTVTGLSYPIILTEIGDLLTTGDEIAVFDGDLCVGAIRYQRETKLVLNAWRSDPEHNLPGYTPGQKMDIRLKTMDGGERSLLRYQTEMAKFEDGTYQVINLAKATALPKEYALSQNYPNPFNPSTVVQFALPEAAHVTLEIYNLLGRKVTTLIDDDYQAGNHEVTWAGEDSNGRAVSTGVYFYRLSANDYTQTKKMMLVK